MGNRKWGTYLFNLLVALIVCGNNVIAWSRHTDGQLYSGEAVLSERSSLRADVSLLKQGSHPGRPGAV